MSVKTREIGRLLGSVAALNAKHGTGARPQPDRAAPADVSQILRSLDEFMECVRYLNTRRSTTAVLELDSEAAVQDALYLMLRPWVVDLIAETPTDRIANRYTIKDFASASSRVVIEAKFIRDRDHGRQISREIHDDIENYRHHISCRYLIFFIYDPDAQIPDRASLERQVVTKRSYDGIPLDCYLIVKP
jgi:hypothetical protein